MESPEPSLDQIASDLNALFGLGIIGAIGVGARMVWAWVVQFRTRAPTDLTRIIESQRKVEETLRFMEESFKFLRDTQAQVREQQTATMEMIKLSIDSGHQLHAALGEIRADVMSMRAAFRALEMRVEDLEKDRERQENVDQES